MKLTDAEQAVEVFCRKEKPQLAPTVKFPLKEITTAEVWDRLGAQIFQVTGDIDQFSTYLIRGGRVHRLGTGFGGHGVMSFVVAELAGGRPWLVYTYSWGSGRHRSKVAALDLLQAGSPELTAELALLDGDWFVRAAGTAVVLETGQYGSEPNRWTKGVEVGRVEFDLAANAMLVVRLRDDLPAAVREKLAVGLK